MMNAQARHFTKNTWSFVRKFSSYLNSSYHHAILHRPFSNVSSLRFNSFSRKNPLPSKPIRWGVALLGAQVIVTAYWELLVRGRAVRGQKRSAKEFQGDTPYYGKSWGYATDYYIELSLQDGDLLFFEFNLKMLHVHEVVKKLLVNYISGTKYDGVGVVFHDENGICCVADGFQQGVKGKVCYQSYSEWLGKSMYKKVTLRRLRFSGNYAQQGICELLRSGTKNAPGEGRDEGLREYSKTPHIDPPDNNNQCESFSFIKNELDKNKSNHSDLSHPEEVESSPPYNSVNQSILLPSTSPIEFTRPATASQNISSALMKKPSILSQLYADYTRERSNKKAFNGISKVLRCGWELAVYSVMLNRLIDLLNDSINVGGSELLLASSWIKPSNDLVVSNLSKESQEGCKNTSLQSCSISSESSPSETSSLDDRYRNEALLRKIFTIAKEKAKLRLTTENERDSNSMERGANANVSRVDELISWIIHYEEKISGVMAEISALPAYKDYERPFDRVESVEEGLRYVSEEERSGNSSGLESNMEFRTSVTGGNDSQASILGSHTGKDHGERGDDFDGMLKNDGLRAIGSTAEMLSLISESRPTRHHSLFESHDISRQRSLRLYPKSWGTYWKTNFFQVGSGLAALIYQQVGLLPVYPPSYMWTVTDFLAMETLLAPEAPLCEGATSATVSPSLSGIFHIRQEEVEDIQYERYQAVKLDRKSKPVRIA